MPSAQLLPSGGLGNTEPTPSHAPVRERGWTITLNNYTEEEYNKLIEAAQLTSQKWVVGKEVGEKCKTPHLQGYIYVKNKISLKTLKKEFSGRAHFEVAKGTPEQNYAYCIKEGDYKANGFTKELTFKEKLNQRLLKKYENIEWKSWQKAIIDIVNSEPDSRTINWVCDYVGNSGKSFLTKYLALTKNVIIADGKKDNIFNQVNRMLNEDEIEFEVVMLDIPRSGEGYVNYGVLEQLKNGLIYSGKYEGGVCAFDDVHVIVFANFMPNQKEMSGDRWNIIEL